MKTETGKPLISPKNKYTLFALGVLALCVLTFVTSLETYSPTAVAAQAGQSQDIKKVSYLRPHTYTNYTLLTRSIAKIGTIGQDVLFIKRILNDAADTKIAITGVDSPGKETNSFTVQTFQAVQKFQKKYQLLPTQARTSNGTILGYVSGITLTKFDELLKQKYEWSYLKEAALADLTTKTFSEKDLLLRLEDLYKGYPEDKIMRILRTATTNVKSNSTLQLYGVGFSYVNAPAVTWGGLVFPIKVESNYKAKLDIPYNVPLGTITLTATSTDPTTPKASIGQSVAKITLTRGTKPAVVDAPASELAIAEADPVAPNIFSITPERGIIGTTVTVKGSNFTPTGNTVWTPYGLVENVASPDGKTLTFKMDFKPLWEFRRIRYHLDDEDDEDLMPTHFKYQFGVYNANGASSQYLLFDSIIWF